MLWVQRWWERLTDKRLILSKVLAGKLETTSSQQFLGTYALTYALLLE